MADLEEMASSSSACATSSSEVSQTSRNEKNFKNSSHDSSVESVMSGNTVYEDAFEKFDDSDNSRQSKLNELRNQRNKSTMKIQKVFETPPNRRIYTDENNKNISPLSSNRGVEEKCPEEVTHKSTQRRSHQKTTSMDDTNPPSLASSSVSSLTPTPNNPKMPENQQHGLQNRQKRFDMNGNETHYRNQTRYGHSLREYQNRIHHLELELERQSKAHERKISDMEKEHTSDIDQILSQLDELEQDFVSQLDSCKSQIQQNDIIISALTSQLNDAQESNHRMHEEQSRLHEIVQTLEEEKMSFENRLNQHQRELDAIKEDYELQLENERHAKKAALKMVENDIRKAAEEQFAAANRIYLEVKTDRDDLYQEVAELMTQLQTVQAEKEETEKLMRVNERNFLAECTQLKADLASAQASLTTKTNEYLIAKDKMEQRERELQNRVQEFKTEMSAMQNNLKDVCVHRDNLIADNKELKTVCEELMEIVEEK